MIRTYEVVDGGSDYRKGLGRKTGEWSEVGLTGKKETTSAGEI